MKEPTYDLHPQTEDNRHVGWLLYIYDGKEGQNFWETGVLPDGQSIRDRIPNIANILDIDPAPKHKRNWAHKFSITIT